MRVATHRLAKGGDDDEHHLDTIFVPRIYSVSNRLRNLGMESVLTHVLATEYVRQPPE